MTIRHMKSETYFLVGALVVIAIIAILKKYFFEVADYDLATQSNALKFGIEGYEDAEASDTKADDGYEESETKADDEEIEGYEDEEEDEEEVEHMTTAAKDKRETKKRNAKLRAAAKNTKAYKLKADKTKADTPKPKADKPEVAEEKFENTPRFQELKAKWDAYKANKGPALTEAERKEMLVLLDMPNESATQDDATKKDESLEQFEEMPYQGMEYAMF